jgi:hypothetical protein
MWNALKFRIGIVVGLVVAVAIGCSKEVPPAVPSASTTEEEPVAVPPVDADETGATDPGAMPPSADGAAIPAPGDQAEAEMIKASFASLSAPDREAATKQRICPVTDAPLGTMGTPIKLSVGGQEVFICCEHCEEPLKAESEKYLAKIGLKPADDGAAE